MNKNDLKPSCVFEQFARINQIPRPSKREEKIIAYLKEFGESRGLDTEVDEAGNVIIRKAATPGYENKEMVVLQSHSDMVCDKLVDIDFDFDNDPIQTYVDGEWLRAKGTTLGADDGIGCAIELAILDSNDIKHGPIECLFTRDEETGMTGAFGMKPNFMKGKMLINLDSEDEGQIFVSCAGGITTYIEFDYTKEEAPAGMTFMMASLKGLTGGHSGDDINKKRANGIKILTRFIYMEQNKMNLRLASFNSGKMHNAIPRDGKVVFAVESSKVAEVKADWAAFQEGVRDEFHVTDKTMEFALTEEKAEKVLPEETGRKLIMAMQAVHNGVFAVCQDEALNNMTETSSNIASIKTTDDKINIVASQRSNVMSNLQNMANTIRAAFELAGAQVKQGDRYPAWKMNADSKLTAIVVETYKKLFNKDPKVLGIHAGLECGLFSEKYPDMDMVSFGPTLRDVHTPDERLYIPTVQMVWDHLLEVLANIPEK